MVLRPSWGHNSEMNSSVKFQGQFLDGQSANCRQVTIEFQEFDVVVIENSQILISWELDQVAVTELSSTHFSLTSVRQPGEILLQGQAVRDILIALKKVSKQRNMQLVFLSLLAVLAAVIGVFLLALDPLSKSIARKLPVKAEETIMPQMIDLFAKDACDDKSALDVAKSLTKKLSLPKDQFDPTVLIIDSPQVNAFAVPGGAVILTSGFLKDVKSGEEIAGVLAHELEHIERRHSMARIVRAGMTTGAWQIMTGDVSQLFVLDPSILLGFASLKFDRDDEREADRGAIKRLSRAKFSEHGLRDFFERLSKKESKNLGFLSTHPSSAERAALFREKSKIGKYRPALLEADFQTLQKACDVKSKSTKKTTQ